MSSDYDLSSQRHRELMFAAAYVPVDIPRDAVDDDEFMNMTTPVVTVDSMHTRHVYVVLTNNPDMTDHYVLRQRNTTPNFHRSSPDDVPPPVTFEYDVVAVFSSECHENLTSAVLCIAQAMMRDDAREAELSECYAVRNAWESATRA